MTNPSTTNGVGEAPTGKENVSNSVENCLPDFEEFFQHQPVTTDILSTTNSGTFDQKCSKIPLEIPSIVASKFFVHSIPSGVIRYLSSYRETATSVTFDEIDLLPLFYHSLSPSLIFSVPSSFSSLRSSFAFCRWANQHPWLLVNTSKLLFSLSPFHYLTSHRIKFLHFSSFVRCSNQVCSSSQILTSLRLFNFCRQRSFPSWSPVA